MVSLTCLAQTGADPITDRMRYEIAVAQRDYLIARQQLDAAAAVLKERIERAQKACAAVKASFDIQKFSCEEKITPDK